MGLLTQEDLDGRRFVTLTPRVDVHLADVTHEGAAAFGIDAGIGSTVEYAGPQSWAAAFKRDGFQGVWYWLRHDPKQLATGIALFGSSGDDPGEAWILGDSYPVSNEVLEDAEVFGIRLQQNV